MPAPAQSPNARPRPISPRGAFWRHAGAVPLSSHAVPSHRAHRTVAQPLRSRCAAVVTSERRCAVDWDEVFAYYDIDRSGELDLAEFTKAIRKDAEIRVHQVSDEDLRVVFDEIVGGGGGGACTFDDIKDIDRQGTVGVKEFKDWLTVGSASPKADDGAAEHAAAAQGPSSAKGGATATDGEDGPAEPAGGLQKVVEGPIWHWGLMVCICLSTACLAYDYNGITEQEIRYIELSNIFFTVLFTAEILIELAVYPPAEYCRCTPLAHLSALPNANTAAKAARGQGGPWPRRPVAKAPVSHPA